MWVEFVVGCRPCSAGFPLGSPVFLPSQKPTFPNSNSTWKEWMKSHSVDMSLPFILCFNLFIYLFIYLFLLNWELYIIKRFICGSIFYFLLIIMYGNEYKTKENANSTKKN